MITLPSFPELEFEERRHVYKLNGVVIPSVTTVMKPLSDDVYGKIDQMLQFQDTATECWRVFTALLTVRNYKQKFKK